MPEVLKVSQIGFSPLLPPFRGLDSPGVRKHSQIIFACYFRKSSILRQAQQGAVTCTTCTQNGENPSRCSTRDAKDLLVKSEWRAGKDRAHYRGMSPRNKCWWWGSKMSNYKTDIKLTTRRVRSLKLLLRIVLFNLTCSKHTRSLACEG